MHVYALLWEDILTWENVTRTSALVLLVPNSPSTTPSPPSSSQYHLVHLSTCCSLCHFLVLKSTMENLTAYITQTQSSPHLATISNDSLNDLLRSIGSQKNCLLSYPHGFKAMAPLSPTLDSTTFQPVECNSQIRAHPPPADIRQPSPHNPSTDMDLSTPQVAYNVDTLGSVGQSDSFTQVSAHQYSPNT